MSKSYYRKPKPINSDSPILNEQKADEYIENTIPQEIEVISIVDNNPKSLDEIIETQPVAQIPLFSVTVNCPHLTLRAEPSFQSERLGLVHYGDKCDIYATQENWGQLKDKSWICLDYTDR